MPPTPPLSTSKESPDTLPMIGYSVDQLEGYIRRKLGGDIFVVELSKQQVLDAIQDSLGLYSNWRPRIRYGAIKLVAGRTDYLRGEDMGLGPISVDFVQRSPIPQSLFWGSLIDVAPLMTSGLDQYDTYLRWQKTWMRVTSVEPQWAYDDVGKMLLIHNPIERFHAGVVAYVGYSDTKQLDRFGADWVKEYAFQQARLSLSEIMNKFSGAIPGPVKDLQLDAAKRDKAEAAIVVLKEKLFAAQVSTPCFPD